MAKKDPLRFTFRIKKDTDIAILKFCEEQSNLSDAIAYLIEKEISENGIRNLSKYIPAVRDFYYSDIENKQHNEIKPSKSESILKKKIESKPDEIDAIPDCYID